MEGKTLEFVEKKLHCNHLDITMDKRLVVNIFDSGNHLI